MKKSILLISGLLFLNGLSAQSVQNQGNEKNDKDVSFIKCSSFEISKAVRDLPDALETGIFKESDDDHDRRHLPPITNLHAQNEDKALQLAHGSKSMSSTVQNWQGQAGNSCPPDPTGSAGLTQYAQAVNLSFRVYNKSTGAPLIAAKDLKTFWPGSLDDGDPIVLYDKAADRWFIMQFQVTDNSNKIHIAISTTNDATGTYYIFTYVPAASDTPDYPKFSIWSDGYYMTSNYTTPKIVVFDRTKMLAGNSAAGMIVKTLPSPITGGFFCPLAGDASDSQLPPSTVTYCPIFSYEDDSWGAPQDQLRIWKMHVDFTTPANTTIASDQTIATIPFDAASFNPNWNDIPQPGTSQKIDAIAGVLNYRAQYRRWNGYNTVTICHAVKISASQTGIRWYELRQDQNTNVWSIYQQSTLAPDALNRWMGSIGMDDNGNIGMAYCTSGSTAPNYLSLRYTGRLKSDPLNQMTFAEQTAIASTSSLTTCGARDGDYTHLMLDPDGQTFWHTGEYCVSNSPATRIYSFKISGPAVTPPVANFNTSSSTVCAGQSVALTDVSTNSPTSWSWVMAGGTPPISSLQNPSVTYAADGTHTISLTATNSGGSSAVFSKTITVKALPNLTVSSQTICAGQTASIAGSGAAAYSWNTGSVDSSLSITPASTTSYTVTGTTNGCSQSAVATVTVNSDPAIPVITANGNILTSSASFGNQWYLNGVLINGEVSQTYTVAASGTYTVIVTSTFGCSTSSVPLVITTTGINPLINNDVLSIYPNPASSSITINFVEKSKETLIEIMNDLGQLVYSEKADDCTKDCSKIIDMSPFMNGIYLFRIHTNGITYTKKVLVVK